MDDVHIDDSLDRPPADSLPEHSDKPYLPTPSEWRIMLQQADVLSRSDLVPAAYRGKPENIVLAAMAGRPFGWDPAMSMRSFHIIEGQPSLKPEIMLALIRRAGHKVSGSWSGEGADICATVTGVRSDTGDEMTVSFSIADAVRAGLCRIKDGQPFARSSTGRPLPWEQYPKAMCWARAVSALGRALFSDVLLGSSYVPEELGAVVDEHGDVIDVESVELPSWVDSAPVPTVVDSETGERLRARANALSGQARRALKVALNDNECFGFPLRLAVEKLPVVEALLDRFEAQDAATNPADETGHANVEPVSGSEPPEPVVLTEPEALELAALPFDELIQFDADTLIAACSKLGVVIDDGSDDVESIAAALVDTGREY